MRDSCLVELTQVRDSAGADLERCWEIRQRYHAPEIRFDRPAETLPISLTGEACALHCAHCNGVYLQHMHTLSQARNSSASSALISGG
ncbi:MAG: radical SAM protein, partial [Anaerolineae bacterium]